MTMTITVTAAQLSRGFICRVCRWSVPGNSATTATTCPNCQQTYTIQVNGSSASA